MNLSFVSTLLAAALIVAKADPPGAPKDERGTGRDAVVTAPGQPAAKQKDPTRAWESPGAAVLSPDGRWFACTTHAEPERGRMRVRTSDGGQLHNVSNGWQPMFSGDSKSLAYLSDAPGEVGLIVKDLESWTTKQRFSGTTRVFSSPDGSSLIMDSLEGGAEVRERHLVIYSLADDRVAVTRPTSFFELSGDGRFVAIVEKSPAGRSVLAVIPTDGSDPGRIADLPGVVEAMAWGDDSRALAARLTQETANGETTDLLIAVPDATAGMPKVHRFGPAAHPDWPPGAFLDLGAPRALAGGQVVCLSVRAASRAAPQQPPDPSVEVHRSIDEVVVDSMTHTIEERLPRGEDAWDMVFAWLPGEGRLVRVADTESSIVIASADAKRLLVVNRRGGLVTGPSDAEPSRLEEVSLRSGKRTTLAECLAQNVVPSHSGRYVAFFSRGHWWAYDSEDGSRRNLTAGLGSDFRAFSSSGIDDRKAAGGVTWLDGDAGLVVSDDFDAWLLHSDGREPRRLTSGRERSRKYRLVTSRPSPAALQSVAFDFHVFDTRTKQSGYSHVDVTGVETPITFGPWVHAQFSKARDAECRTFLRDSTDAPPNFYVINGTRGRPVKMTELNPSYEATPSLRRELIQYKDRHGMALQGTLIYPAGYDPAKTYPMVVSIYQILSDSYFAFCRPDPGQFDDPSTIADAGYFVLLPDIAFRPRELGPAAVDCVEAAVREVLSRDNVDPGRIGLMGQSLGGYETAFILCSSRLFAAGVSVNPPADWARHFLTGRLGNVHTEAAWLRTHGMVVPFWDDPESYALNSVLTHAHGITAPLLIGIGRQDAVVDYREGESIFNLLRYLKRPAYLVAYRQGGHGLGGNDDFNRRVRQFLDHYLKGAPPADWLRSQRSLGATDKRR